MSSPQDPLLARLFAANKQWSRDVEHAEPGFFERAAKGQAPKVLWIGCADSRVPETVVTGERPGEIFVHRNIANQFHKDDVSAHSVLQYAVEHLGVEHVVVVGHTQCGGAAATLAAATSAENKELIPVPKHPPTDPINVWLKPMTLLAARLAARHDNLSTWPAGEALQLLVEENVKAQVANVLNSSIIQNAWMNGQDISVHGWVFEIESGQLRDLKVTKGRG